ncbi:hypothetical protein HOF40_00830, partial [Candidatus Parcubacteria bacterium]|nr:hypothetical protein [Candidatus Parcubacteria bacterium]
DGKKALGIKAIEARLDKFGKKRSVWWRAFAVMFDDTVAGLYTLVVMALVDFCVDGIVSYAIVA